MPYIIKKSTLTGIADAIRGKTGGTDKMNPVEMASAIEGISAGGGDIDALIDGSLTELTSNAESVADFTFYGNETITKANLPKATSIGEDAFGYCSNLKTINFPKLTTIGQRCFYSCTAFEAVEFPLLAAIDFSGFERCSNLHTADFLKVTEVNQMAFKKCFGLTALILRSDQIATLAVVTTFSETPIANGTGYVYVPRALVDSYKSATNWSAHADQFRALEDYTVDGTITGKLDESKI